MRRFTGLCFIGNGSCFNTKFGNNSAYYFDSSTDSLFLIDCGESIFERLCSLKDFNKAKHINILITHMHTDHVGSLPSLIFFCKFVRNIVPTIIFPNHMIMKHYLTLTGVKEDMYNLVTPNSFYKYPISMHRQKHSPNIEAYGYTIFINRKTVYYSGDSGSITDEILDYFNDGYFDYFYQDVTRYVNSVHMNIDELAKLIPEEKRNLITCMHFDDKETLKIAKNLGFKVAKIS